MDVRRRTYGFTVIEALVVLGIIGVFLSIGWLNLRSPAATLVARDIQAQLMQARQEAVKRNGPVAVIWNESLTEFTTRFTDTRDWSFSSSPCSATPATALRTQEPADVGRVSISVAPSSSTGTVFLPNGQRRDCDGSSASSVSLTVDDGSGVRVVTIQALGRVEIE